MPCVCPVCHAWLLAHSIRKSVIQVFVLELAPMRQKPNNAQNNSVTSGADVLRKRGWRKFEWSAIVGTQTVK